MKLKPVSTCRGKLGDLKMIPPQNELFITDEIPVNMITEMRSIRKREEYMRENGVHSKREVLQWRKNTLIRNHIKSLLRVQRSAPPQTIFVNPKHPAGTKLLQMKRSQFLCVACEIYLVSRELLEKHIASNHIVRTGFMGPADQKTISEVKSFTNSESVNKQQTIKQFERNGMNYSKDKMLFKKEEEDCKGGTMRQVQRRYG